VHSELGIAIPDLNFQSLDSGSAVLLFHGTSTVEVMVGYYRHGTVVPHYHKYRGTTVVTVRYLPTNNHFSEDFSCEKSVY